MKANAHQMTDQRGEDKNAALGQFLGSEVIRWRSKNWTVLIETEDWKISQRRWVELETLLIQPKNSIKDAKKS